MKVLVTGSAGLVGKELVAQLHSVGTEVTTYDLRVTDGMPSRDVRDSAGLRAALRGCAGVYHLAAVSRVAWGEEDPANCRAINADATQLLVDLMLEENASWLVFASSREVYGNPASRLVKESDPIAPVNAYGRSKAEAESIIEKAKAIGLRASLVRLSNVYGTTNDHPDRAVPALLWRALHNEPILLTGGDNYFDFVHVRDCVRGLLAAGERLSGGATNVETVHLATGVATSLSGLATLATATCDSSSEITRIAARAFDVSGFCGDPALSSRVLDWRALVPLADGLAELRDAMLASGRPIPPAIMPGPFST